MASSKDDPESGVKGTRFSAHRDGNADADAAGAHTQKIETPLPPPGQIDLHRRLTPAALAEEGGGGDNGACRLLHRETERSYAQDSGDCR